MPLIRRIITAGKTSKAIILPKSWLDWHEKESGCTIEEVAIDVNSELRIKPIIPNTRARQPLESS